MQQIILEYNETIVPLFIKLHNSEFVTEELKDTIEKMSTQSICPHLSQTVRATCGEVNNGTFVHGFLNSYYYIEEVTKYFSKKDIEERKGQNMTSLILTESINTIITFQMVRSFQ